MGVLMFFQLWSDCLGIVFLALFECIFSLGFCEFGGQC